jgi:serine/threonine protein kinase
LSASILVKKLAGKYEVLRELGSGAAGHVYLVKHPDLSVRYALKVLHPKTLNDPNFVEQFKREAEVLLRFTHEGCVQLRDFGRLESGEYYMATDYCEGGTLKDLLLRIGRLDPVYALHILAQLLEVLHAAHERSIVHRDIKPENIMIERDYKGRDLVKVLDFGIAKLLEMELELDEDAEQLTLGTPGYMSPEQAYGETDLDHRVDIYAAAVVGYEMIVGRPPFRGENPQEILIAHVTQQPEEFAKRLKLPQKIQDTIFKGLEKGRERRYKGAELFRKACLDAVEAVQNYRPLEEEKEELEVKTAPVQEEPAKAQPTQPEKAVGKKENILILDDEETLLSLTKHILEHDGFTTFTASNCSSIHQYLFEEDVSLLLTDVQMPDMPGWKVCKMLKDSLPELKIILFSNIDEKELAKLASESKADGWISKRTSPQEWLVKIKEVLAAS